MSTSVVQSNSVSVRPVAARSVHIGSITELPKGGRIMPLREMLAALGVVVSDSIKDPPIGVWVMDKNQIIAARERPQAYLLVVDGIPKNVMSLQHDWSRRAGAAFDILGSFFVSATLLQNLHDNQFEEISSQEKTEAIRRFERVFELAMARSASDVHFECRLPEPIIRIRVHGDMVDLETMTKGIMSQMVSAGYNYLADVKKENFNSGKMQAASIPMTIKGQPIKLRWEHSPIYPPNNGYFAGVARILRMGNDQGAMSGLRLLGYSGDQEQSILEAVDEPVGMVLLSGVTGSGKSTTLMNLMLYINDIRARRQKSYSVEDPTEYIIRDVCQIVVESESERDKSSGSGFTAALKSLLRMDPDLIMLGEIRDAETADIIKKMVQTGHQCLSTVHTTSALGIVSRLNDIGLEWNTLGEHQILNGLVYQRLVKILCPECKRPLLEHMESAAASDRDRLIVDQLRVALESDAALERVYVAATQPSCPRCHGAGVVARQVAAEVVIPTTAMRSTFAEGRMDAARLLWRSLSDRSVTSGSMAGKTALEHALLKVYEGTVSPFDIAGSAGFGRLDAAVREYRDMDDAVARNSTQDATTTDAAPRRPRPWQRDF